MAEEGENVGGGIPGLFWSHETTRRMREDRQSSGIRRGSEGVAVAAANGVGGDELRSGGEGERAEERNEGESEGRSRGSIFDIIFLCTYS